MKKLIALVLCIVFVCTLSVTAFAVESPGANEKYTVTMKNGTGVQTVTANDTATEVAGNQVVIAKPDSSKGSFSEWTVYKRNPDGSLDEAVPGTDFELQDGSTLTAEELKLKPKADLVFVANYNNTYTDPTAGASDAGTKYKIIKGADSTWKQGSGKDLLIASNAPFEKFKSVEVDGATIAASNYTAASGSTEITLKASYLQTLALGDHSFTITSNDGAASTRFHVVDANGNSTSPKTGSNTVLYVVMMLIAAAAVCFGAVKVYSK